MITAWDRRYCKRCQRERVHARQGGEGSWICIGRLPKIRHAAAKCGDPVNLTGKPIKAEKQP
jgi:hypothetical protein